MAEKTLDCPACGHQLHYIPSKNEYWCLYCPFEIDKADWNPGLYE